MNEQADCNSRCVTTLPECCCLLDLVAPGEAIGRGMAAHHGQKPLASVFWLLVPDLLER